jgi:hypothetical protein
VSCPRQLRNAEIKHPVALNFKFRFFSCGEFLPA